jgi:hypothetical protein
MADQATLPSEQEFFGGSQSGQQLPSADEFFAPSAMQTTWHALTTPVQSPASGPAWDAFFTHTSVGRVLNAFGQGAKDGWGNTSLGLTDNDAASLKRAGILPDYEKGQTDLVKSFNEAIIRPAAVAVDAALRGTSAVSSAAAGGLEQLSKETGPADLGHPLSWLAGFGADVLRQPEALLGVPVFHGAPPELTEARTMRVIGEGEEGWKGIAEPKAPDPTVAEDAVKSDIEAHEPPSGAPQEPAPEPSLPTLAPTIHEVARSVAPEVFTEYDALLARQNTFRQWIQDLGDQRRAKAEAESPHAQEIADLQAKIPDATPRLAKKYQARLEDLTEQHNDFIESAMSQDTQDMAKVRAALQQNDYRLRDIAPQVSAAYRQAADAMGPLEGEAAPEATPEPEAVPAAQIAPQEAATPPEAPQEAAQPQPVVAQAAPVQATGEIADDVAKKLVNAGRPEDEARAAAGIIQAYYETRANRFAGAKGTPEELYRAEGPDIRGEVKGGPRGEAKGKTRFTASGRKIITLFDKADASTFIHETGHAWLEDLLDDADDQKAPQQLKDDAKAVRDWLGAEKDVTGRQHEKFARGFETYMREGRAPTQGLARIFEQFKQWLTTIYQKATQLRAPITDDIRAVFDRMLATSPDHPIIAPEREPAESFAEIHEADAKAVPPEHADEAADQIRAEADKEAIKEPEVADEINGPTGGIAGGRAPEGAAPDRNGPQRQVELEPAGADTQPGAVGAGGSTGEAEGGGLQQKRAGRGHGRAEPPAGPNAEFTLAETDLLDKAGNIRLENLNGSDEAKQLVREVYARNQARIDAATRGVVSDQAVMDTADALGVSPQAMADNIQRMRKMTLEDGVPLAARIWILRKAMIESAQHVYDAMQGDDEVAYALASARHLMLQETLTGVTAEMGRGLRAFRSQGEAAARAQELGQFLEANTGKTLYQIKAEMKLGRALDTPKKVSKFLQDAKKPTFTDMAFEYYVNNLISGPATHTTYMAGNMILAVWKSLTEKPVAAAIGSLREIMSGKEPIERAYFGEAPAELYGLMKGVPQGLQAAWQAVKTGATTALPGEDFTYFALQPKQGAIPGVLGRVIRTPSRAVAAIHSFFRAVGYSQAKDGLAYRAALAESAVDVRLGKPAWDVNKIAQRVGEIETNPSEEIMEAARNAATEQTLMGKGGPFTQAVSNLVNKPILGVPVLKFVMPFVKIGSNIMRQGLLERTPLGITDPAIRANLMGKNGAAARDLQLARMAVGSALGATSFALAAQGVVTGGGPSDPKEAAIWRMTGKQPYSIKIGDTWYGIHRLGPLAVIVGLAADAYEFGHAMENASADKVANLMVTSITKGLLDETWMRGPAELVQALQDPERYGARWARDELTAFAVPFSVGMSQIARAVDPYTREARTIVSEAMSKVPWLSQTLLPRRDIWGEPIPNKDVFGVAGLSAIYESRVNNDPVNQALLRLNIFPSLPERRIRGVMLTDQQYDDYSRVAGRLTKARLNAIVAQPGFTSLPNYAQTQMIENTIRTARESARSLVMMQSVGGQNDIVREALATKRAQMH